MKESFIQTNGILLHTLQAGEETNPLVVLLHGFPENGNAWRNQMKCLADAGFWVWAPDQRGYNLSDKPVKVKSYRIDELALDVIGLMDAARREKAFIVGHDWGASIAWWIAIHYPDRLFKMIAINGAHVKVGWDFRKKNLRQILRSLYMLWFLIPGFPEYWASRKDWLPLVCRLKKGARPEIFTNEMLDSYKTSWSVPGSFKAMIHWYRAGIFHFPKLKENSLLTIPLMLIWGAQDIYIRKELAIRSLEMCMNGKLLLFENAGHWIHHEQSELINQCLLDFIADGSTDLPKL